MSPSELDAEVVVVGAGVVGLACAVALGRAGRSVVVVERNDGCARETSAHNSGVIHAGIYYPTGSLKHRMCIAGNRALYEWCGQRGVPARRTGKLVVALEPDELAGLEAVLRQTEANDVPGISVLTEVQARALEPAVPAVGAVLSESSGVVDQAALARSLESAARDHGALFAYVHEVTGATRGEGGFHLQLRGPDGERVELRCAALVNSAGHGAPALASALGYPLDGGEGVPAMRQHINRGRYYDIVGPEAARAVTRLVYPLPRHDLGGLGVHLTIDVDGALHLGPDAAWLPDGAAIDYRVDDEPRAEFLTSGQRLLPMLRDEDIAPGQVGYRPKLGEPGAPPADFLVWHDRGYVHLGGIESPGLTSCLPLGELVADLLR